MDEEIIVIEWEISAGEQDEMDWWAAHPDATEAEALAAGF